jgi:hypothetical protein
MMTKKMYWKLTIHILLLLVAMRSVESMVFDLIPITWNDLAGGHQRLPAGDEILATEEDIDPNTTEFVLELANYLDWWKGVQLLNDTNEEIGFIEVKGKRSSPAGPITVASSDINVGGKIILCKAKMFGLHTGIYALTELACKQGKRVTFRWSAD